MTAYAEPGAAPPPPSGSVGVMVASFRDRALLDACLSSLLPQCEELGAALVVARAGAAEELSELERSYPQVRFVRASQNTSLPRLRGMGLAAVDRDVVALTEDHCVAGPDWLAQLSRATGDVVGGAMDNAQRDRAIDWAAFFSEYGFFAPDAGREDGHTSLLTGANVAYRRSVLDDVVAMMERGEWENIVHDRLAAQGATLRFLRTATVYQNRRYQFWDFCGDRFEHGRDYARRRLDEVGSRRWWYCTGSLALPFVLSGRVARAAGRRHFFPFMRALPITFAFLTAWSVGEAVGYWRGPAAGTP